MKVGLISDIHMGYSHGTKAIADGPMAGVNVREKDFIDAAFTAVTNLKKENVDFIVDAGDIAHVPAPKKRAISKLIELIKYAEVPFYSVDGNHTSLKSVSDIHLYHILNQECQNFHGWVGHGITHQGVGMVPHSYNPDVTMGRIEEVMGLNPIMLVGHWAASDIKYDNSQVPLDFLPDDIPVFLGHFHKHTEQKKPTYIGSTERTAWDQWDYPTGVSVYDTDTGTLKYIQHPTRKFVNLLGNSENYLDVIASEDLTDAIVRLTITAGRQEYGTLNFREAKRRAHAAGALTYHHRRAKDKNEEAETAETVEISSVNDAWIEHIRTADLENIQNRERIEQLGLEALGG